MFKKWFSRKKDDDDEDFDEEDFDMPDSEADEEADAGVAPDQEDADATVDAGGSDDDSQNVDEGEPGASSDAGMADDGDDLDDIDFDDDEEEEEDESRLLAMWDNIWIRFSIIGIIIALLLVLVGIGGWWFISSGAEEDMAVQTVGGDLPAVSSGGGLQPEGSLNALSVPEGEVSSASQYVPPATVSADGVTGEQLANTSASALGTSSGLNAIGTGGSGLNAITGTGTGGAVSGGGIVIPMSTASSFSQFPDYPVKDALSKAPIPELLEFRGEELPLPKLSLDGRASWQEYARPNTVPSDTKRVALLVTGLGLSRAATLSAISKLPAAVSLSFTPYADELEQWMIRSRRKGHEVLLGLPLESARFPIEDPGPLALKTGLSDLENKVLLEKILSSQQGYIGVDVFMGSRFTMDEDSVRNLLTELNSRGLMILDDDGSNRSLIPRIASELGMPIALSNVRLDDVMAKAAVDAKLKELLSTVELRGAAIGTTTITPAIMERVLAWVSSLPGRNIELVPVSALIKTR